MTQRISRCMRTLAVAGLLSLSFLTVDAAPAHASAQSHEAVVDANGTLVNGVGVVGVTHIATGQYEVTFDIRVHGCSYTASIGDPGTGYFLRPGLVFVASGHLSYEGVFIETKNPGGGLTDYPFHLQVKCVEQGAWAVVTAAGNYVRGSGGLYPVYRMGPGLYEIGIGYKGCSMVATIGDTGNRLVASPATIETEEYPGGFYGAVHIRDLKGAPADRPFHLQVQCQQLAHGDFVAVDKTGAKVAGSVWSAARIGRGQYEVYPYRNVANCVLVGTATFLADTPAHLVFPGVDPATPTFIYVEVTDLNGRPADAGFSLQITFLC